MLVSTVIAILTVVISTVSAAAIFPARQAPAPPPCSPTTVYITVTIIDRPDTVTVALVDSASIAAQAASAAAIDTEYENEQSQLRPVSAPRPSGNPVHTNTLTAPAFTATEDPSGNYVLNNPTTTIWGVQPTGNHVPVSSTTVTVYPVPARPLGTAGHDVSGTMINTTTFTVQAGGSSYGQPSEGYVNNTSLAVSPVATTSSSGVLTVTSTKHVATTTLAVDFNVTASPGNDAPPPSQTSGIGQIFPRQTCTEISAPGAGTWCNNYGGTTTYDFSIWDTTTTPGVTATPFASTTTVVVEGTSTATNPPGSPAASPSPGCGESGPFEIDFDDLPAFSPTNNETQDWPVIFNPSDHFWWADDWTYGPPPNEPYPPHGGSQLAVYIPHLNDNTTDSPVHNTGSVPDGASFGAGPRKSDSAYWFNATAGFAACNNNATDPNHTCDFVATGFQYTNGTDQVVVTQHTTIKPCANNVNCQLHFIPFGPEFVGLSAMSFYANVQGQLETFYLDSLQLGWYNNSCEAGLERVNSRKKV